MARAPAHMDPYFAELFYPRQGCGAQSAPAPRKRVSLCARWRFGTPARRAEMHPGIRRCGVLRRQYGAFLQVLRQKACHRNYRNHAPTAGNCSFAVLEPGDRRATGGHIPWPARRRRRDRKVRGAAGAGAPPTATGQRVLVPKLGVTRSLPLANSTGLCSEILCNLLPVIHPNKARRRQIVRSGIE